MKEKEYGRPVIRMVFYTLHQHPAYEIENEEMGRIEDVEEVFGEVAFEAAFPAIVEPGDEEGETAKLGLGCIEKAEKE